MALFTAALLDRRMWRAGAVVVACWAAIACRSSRTAARDIGPSAGLCAAINALPAGEELVLAPGDYQGPCVIRRGGTTGAPLVIRAADLTRRPRIVYDGHTSNVVEVRADHVTLRGLAFGPTKRDIDAVRVFTGNDVTVEDCRFEQLGGIAVAASHASVHSLVVRRNVIRNSSATAMYFGCHDGRKCSVTDLVVEGNFIDGVTAPDPQIGYGVEIKLNSAGIIRNNTIMNTKGPPIMVYGSGNLDSTNLVERNVVIGSRTSSGIVAGGGPAIVRNNLAISNREAGVGLEDYGRRGLLRNILVANNTVFGNRDGGITIPAAGNTGVMVANNAAAASAGIRAFPSPQAGVQMEGNVDCSAAPCFVDSAQMDFSPAAASPLKGAGVFFDHPGMPRDDLFGVPRRVPSTAGAIERSAPALTLVAPP